MYDVVIAGAGPAGSVAGLILARAGARVIIVDRETFPRGKLCGDTVNPGALGLLTELGLDLGPFDDAPALSGMLVTGQRTEVLARYGGGLIARAITREVFDAWLLDAAIKAGARFEPGLTVTRALVDDTSGRPLVRGLAVRRANADAEVRWPATMTIAAEGRRSATALSLKLITHPQRPRRWAFGVYAQSVAGLGDYGEMHVRDGHYIGIAPLSRGVTNVCVVADRHGSGAVPSPREFVRTTVMSDTRLRDRFTTAIFDEHVRVLGPLAVDARAAGVPGLLLAGDAAGFIDPMTGDGLHLAMRGAALAAEEVRAALDDGNFAGAVDRLARSRRRALGSKLRFNRMLRGLVDSPATLRLASYCSSAMPGLLKRVIAMAGDAA